MRTGIGEIERRSFLIQIVSAGLLGTMLPAVLARQALALGAPGQKPQGILKMQGSVMVNGIQAQVGSVVGAGSIITTGSASYAVVIVEKDVYLVRENSRIELMGVPAEHQAAAERTVNSIKVHAGRLLSVFGRGTKTVETVTAVMGVRGSALYVQLFDDITYFCLCYGTADIDPKAYPASQVSITTKHHESPFYILPTGMKLAMLRAPVINHTDEELIMLESLVDSVPPFGNKKLSSGY